MEQVRWRQNKEDKNNLDITKVSRLRGTQQFETIMGYRSSLLIETFELSRLTISPTFSAPSHTPRYGIISLVTDSEGLKPKHKKITAVVYAPLSATISLLADFDGHEP